jgi:ADP-heptose:LPS heptosyltransferase
MVAAVPQVIFKQWQAPGDLLMLTVALRDLHKMYPGLMKTDILCCYPEVFFNNPNIIHLPKDDSVPVVDLKYDKARDKLAPLGYHFSSVFIYLFNELYDLKLIKTSMRPDIHLTKDEKSDRILKRLRIKKPYWLINSGVKYDIPIKGYPPSMWEKIIDGLIGGGLNLYQVGSRNDIHPDHKKVRSLVGETENLRDYFSLVYHSNGCVNHVSMQMHLAAAFHKPCVTIGGGREDCRWEAYPDHRYLNTIGHLDCCQERGCWVSKAEKCKHLWKDTPYATCLAMIEPERVIKEVLNYCRIIN